MGGKFRVFDLENKKYISEFYIDNFAINSKGELIKLAGEYELRLEVVPLSHFKIEFSTGFYDKNGKEIYFGDIVKIYSEWRGTLVEIGEVFFSEPAVYYAGSYILDVFRNDTESIEIIGNIHQNHELLEK